MAYTFYLNRVMMPITPPSMSVTTPNKNETIELIDGSEINVLKEPGLKTFKFELVLPQIEYPFANYKNEKFRNRLIRNIIYITQLIFLFFPINFKY